MNETTHALHRYLILLLLSAYAFGASAQPITEVHKNNVDQFVIEMEQYFGQAMTVTGEQINQFMLPFVFGGNTTTCEAPNPAVTSEAPQQISFEWSGLLFDDYRVGYLNLLTGDQNVSVIDHPDHSFDVEDGLYIFVFQQICGTKKSNAIIIILDKVVALTNVPGMACDCSHTTLYEGNAVDELSLSEFDEMDVMIQHTYINDLTIFQMHMERACPDCIEYNVNTECLNNGNNTNINNINYLEIEGYAGNVLTFSGVSMNLTYDLPSNYEPVVALCKLRPGHNNNGILRMALKPIIPGAVYQVNNLESAGKISSLTLINQTGQIMQQLRLPEGSIGLDHELDLTPYPSGIYFLRIEGPFIHQTRKLIRH